ncbi:hypothetical protein D3C71_1097420 [compost metagenome]
MDEDIWLFELDPHLVLIGHEVGRQITAVELHTFDDFQVGLGSLGFLDGNDTFVADLLHRFGQILADLLVAIGRDGADLSDLRITGDLAGVRLQLFNDCIHGDIDAALQVHRVHARRNRLGAFLDDGLGENSCRGGTVAGEIIGLRCHFAQHLRAHVFELVFQFDLFGDGDAVLGDAWRAERLVDDDVAALRAKRNFYRIGENIDATQHAFTGIGVEFDFFRSHLFTPSIGSFLTDGRQCVITQPASAQPGLR